MMNSVSKANSTSPNIYLVGMPGSGKSAVGKLLARQLGREFVDSDEMVAEQAGRGVAEIFQLDGEAVFRQLETEVFSALIEQKNLVVATGGGAILNDTNADAMLKSGFVVHLKASAPTLADRLNASGELRPLLGQPVTAAKVQALWDARAEKFARFSNSISTDGLTAEAVATQIVEKFKMGVAHE